MKNSIFRRSTSWILLLATLVCAALPLLTSCTDTTPATGTQTQTGEPTTEEAGTTAGETEEENTHVRPTIDFTIPDDKNLVKMLETVPLANANMTEAELRDVVLKFMKVQLTFAYTPDFGDNYDESSYTYYIKNLKSLYGGQEGTRITFEEGKAYGGVPYKGNTCGTIYRWLPFYEEETGFMDWEPIINSQRLNWKNADNGEIWPNVGSSVFGNSCSSACFWAWGRVTNQLKGPWCASWLPSNGYVQVGDYQLGADNKRAEGNDAILAANGRQKMYQAYAQVKAADGFVSDGHATMAISDAHVVYNANGTINGTESYVLIAEQKASFLTASPAKGGVDLYSPMNSEGATYRIMGNWPGTIVNEKVKEMKWNFVYLFDTGYLPFTIPEFSGADPVEKAEASMSHPSETIKFHTIKAKTITSNYCISDVTINVKNKDGKIVYSGFYCPTGVPSKTVSLEGALLNNVIYKNKGAINLALSGYTDGNYTLEVQCRVSTGELFTVYTGTITE
ncbi:MAG: hypothetical protein IKD31_05640 [Clostridia bacterium]|nr:hypothetical protein [Clostridia bacterium]